MAWTTPRTWVTSEIVTSSLMNTHVRDNLSYLKTEADKLNDVSQTDQTSSRAINGTVYQNTSGKIRIVTIVATNSSSGTSLSNLDVRCDTNASPSAQVALTGIADVSFVGSGNFRMCLTFIVPPNYYYKCTGTLATLATWTEYDLL